MKPQSSVCGTSKDFKNANKTKFRSLINTDLPIERTVDSSERIETQIERITTIIQNGAEETISTKTYKLGTKLPQEIYEAIKHRNHMR